MKNAIYTLIVMLLTISCSSYHPPVRQEPVKDFHVAADVEKVWKGLIRFFGEYNIPIENMEHGSLFIKTKPVDLKSSFGGTTLAGKKVPIRNEWCDCGSGKMANVWKSETRILLSFNIILEKFGPSRTKVTVNTFFEGVMLGKRNLYSSGYDKVIQLKCISTGQMEAKLVSYLKNYALTAK